MAANITGSAKTPSASAAVKIPGPKDFEGDFVRDTGNGKVYIVNKGKLYYINNAAEVGGSIKVAYDNVAVRNWPMGGAYADTLKIANYEGKFVNDYITGSAHKVIGGKLFYIKDWKEVGGPQPFALNSSVVHAWPVGGAYADYVKLHNQAPTHSVAQGASTAPPSNAAATSGAAIAHQTATPAAATATPAPAAKPTTATAPASVAGATSVNVTYSDGSATPAPKKSYTAWYVVGAIALVVIVVVAYKHFSK